MDHYVELTKGEKKEAVLPTEKELQEFTYFGDELHAMVEMNDAFTVGLKKGNERKVDVIKKMLDAVRKYALVNVLASKESGYRDITVWLMPSVDCRVVSFGICTPRASCQGRFSLWLLPNRSTTGITVFTPSRSSK